MAAMPDRRRQPSCSKRPSHFTAEMIYGEALAMRYLAPLGTIYNTLNEFARCGLLRQIAHLRRESLVRHQDRPHFHFYREDTEELSDIPDELLPKLDIPAPEGTRIEAIDIIVRLKSS